MKKDIAIEQFKELATQVIQELEFAINTSNPRYPNAEIALHNVCEWLNKAKAGTLTGSYGPSFGISKSDLMFGPVEDRMYELEKIYTDHLLNRNSNLKNLDLD